MLAVIDRYLAWPAEERLRFRVGRRLGYLRNLDDLEDPNLRLRIDRTIEEVDRSIERKRAASLRRGNRERNLCPDGKLYLIPDDSEMTRYLIHWLKPG